MKLVVDVSKFNDGDRGDTHPLLTGGSGESFIITDSRKVADGASKKGIGFAAYLNDSNRQELFPEALYCIDCLMAVSDEQLYRMYLRYKHLPWTITTTQRCRIREITLEDVDRLYELYEDPGISRYTDPLFENRVDEIAYTKEYIRSQYTFYEYGIWIVEDKNSGEIIGRAGLSNRFGYEDVELGYIIGSAFQRQGYATEVCLAIMKYAKERLDIDRLISFVVPGNEASEGLLKKLGFKYKKNVRLMGSKYRMFETIL